MYDRIMQLSARIFPVHRSEVKPMALKFILFFLLCLCHGILRNVKDTIILNGSGANVLAFIKLWGMLPASILATWGYTKIASRLKRNHTFYVVLSLFLLYFLTFAFLIYPNHEHLHLYSLGAWLTAHLPAGLSGIVVMIQNWTFTPFYVTAELWSVVVLAILFWGFINEISKIEEAKRTYGLLNIGSNFSPIAAGLLSNWALHGNAFSFISQFAKDELGQTLNKSVVLVTVIACLAALCFKALYKHSEQNTEEISSPAKTTGKSRKPRLSLVESLRYVSRSRYLLSIAILVFSYSATVTFTDLLWKNQLAAHFQNQPLKLMDHMNTVIIGIGVLSTIASLLFRP